MCEESGQRSSEPGGDAGGVERSALRSAARYLARSSTASSEADGGGKEFSASFKALLEWGEENKLIREAADFQFFNREPDGYGDEHQAWFDEATNMWFKATYPNRFGLGWGGGSTATPKEYLHRLLLQNAYFADRIELVALINWEGKLRVLTSQPHVAGDVASCDEIEHWFEGLGFMKVESNECIAWYHKEENLLVADAHEGNIIRSGGNVLLPIDLNITRPSGDALETILKLTGK